MKVFLLIIVTAFALSLNVNAQKTAQVQLLTSGTNTSLRGMSVPSESVVWVSGSNGTIGKSVNAGKTWQWITIPGFEKRDFRDIEAFDSSTAVAMAVDNPAIIIKTVDGGASWKKVFERDMPGMFLDAMDFKNKHEGVCIGDPIDIKQTNQKQFFIIKTFDGGENWKQVPAQEMPIAHTGEAIFAASGTNISFLNSRHFDYTFATGGATSNLYLIPRSGKQTKVVSIPVVQGKETEGVFSLATNKQKNIYCIGGDYKLPAGNVGNYRFSINGGTTWDSTTGAGPLGYRSCIRIIKKKELVACGPTGVDYAANGQKSWEKISDESFNVCMVSKGGEVFFAGEKGKIGKLLK